MAARAARCGATWQKRSPSWERAPCGLSCLRAAAAARRRVGRGRQLGQRERRHRERGARVRRRVRRGRGRAGRPWVRRAAAVSGVVLGRRRRRRRRRRPAVCVPCRAADVGVGGARGLQLRRLQRRRRRLPRKGRPPATVRPLAGRRQAAARTAGRRRRRRDRRRRRGRHCARPPARQAHALGLRPARCAPPRPAPPRPGHALVLARAALLPVLACPEYLAQATLPLCLTAACSGCPLLRHAPMYTRPGPPARGPRASPPPRQPPSPRARPPRCPAPPCARPGAAPERGAAPGGAQGRRGPCPTLSFRYQNLAAAVHSAEQGLGFTCRP
ncbi:MAG: hypothetical protein J3K34DRAFT_68489 [Monoraphidium minutum]|nr:MAG: hypothetical protein J3K34DRAFT_68489 [Monoraphidium minutum]